MSHIGPSTAISHLEPRNRTSQRSSRLLSTRSRVVFPLPRGPKSEVVSLDPTILLPRRDALQTCTDESRESVGERERCCSPHLYAIFDFLLYLHHPPLCLAHRDRFRIQPTLRPQTLPISNNVRVPHAESSILSSRGA